MSFVEDLAPFFVDFGTAAVWKGTTTVRGIFDADYFDPLGNVVEGNAPVFRCAATDVASVSHGDALTVNAASYKIINVQPDGTGVVLLVLEAQ